MCRTMALPIGQTLRAARLERGLELSDVERATRIRVRFLRAMEEEDWDALPGPAYARGFLDSYARLLGLDAEALVAEFKRDHETALPLEEIPEEMLPRRGDVRPPIRRRILVPIAGLLVALALGAGAVIAVTGGSEDGGGERERAGAQPGDRDTTGPTSGTSTATSTVPTTEPSEVLLSLRSTADVWVCLVTERGPPLVNGEILTAGEERGPFRSNSFEVTLGNGAIQLDADGEPIEIPDSGEPFSYRITTDGSRRIDPNSGPSCT